MTAEENKCICDYMTSGQHSIRCPEFPYRKESSYSEGWNDRDSLVEAEKKEAVKEFKGALLNYILGNVEYGEVYKIIDLLTPEDK